MLKRREYRIIKASSIFDSNFYTFTNPDIKQLGIDPLLHYILVGFAENRQPHPYFDVGYYCAQLEDFDHTQQNPLLHYITTGWKLGLQPNFVFSPLEYQKANPGLQLDGINPLTHYICNGRKEDLKPSVYFDPEFYRNTCLFPENVDHDPLTHYLQIGNFNNVQPSVIFDPQWYADRYSIDRNIISSVFRHYRDFGCLERKSPSPLFDPDFYAKTYAIQDQRDLFFHYLISSEDDSIKPNSWFDPVYYRAQYMENGWEKIPSGINDVTTARPPRKLNPVEHYLALGMRHQTYPNQRIADLTYKPVISVVVPVYNPQITYLNACIRSVVYQSYPHWQLCLADDCSTNSEIRTILEDWANSDQRIRVVFLDTNQGISGATNAAASLASGDYIGFLDNDDELDLDCLAQLAIACNAGQADMLYTDEDLIGADGRRFSLFAKPDYNRELLYSHNYIVHFVLTKRSIFERVGGCHAEMAGAQDYDLVLRLAEQAETIVHVPQILYHWRASATSTSINHTQKEYANEAGRKALIDACRRRKLDAEVELTELKFFYRVQRKIRSQPQVTVVSFWTGEPDFFHAWLSDLEAATQYERYSLLVFVPESTLSKFLHEPCVSRKDLTIHSVADDSTTCEAYQNILLYDTSEWLVFVSSRLTGFATAWLENLLEYTTFDTLGMAGGRIFHTVAGNETELSVVPDYHEKSDRYYVDYLQECSTLMNGLHCSQEVRTVSPDLFLINRAVLQKFSGFNTKDFPDLLTVHDLCFRLIENGYINIYTPYASATRDYPLGRYAHAEHSEKDTEKTRFQSIWQHTLEQQDPSFSSLLLESHGVDVKKHIEWLVGTVQD